MKYDSQKVATYVANMDKKSLSAQEMVAVGKVLMTLGEVQKETDYLHEYLQMSLTDPMGPEGGQFN